MSSFWYKLRTVVELVKITRVKGRGMDTKDYFVIHKETVDFVIVILVSLIPPVIIAGVAAIIIDEGWKYFWWGIAVINIFYFVMWLSRTVVNLVLYKIYFHKRAVEKIFNGLEKDEFPALPEGSFPIDDMTSEDVYLEYMACDSLPCNVRIKSAIYWFEYSSLKSKGSLLNMWSLNKAHRAALRKYAAKYPDRVPRRFEDDDL